MIGLQVKLAKHVYSCLFGTFLCNTKRERLDNVLQENTCSVWAILQVEKLVNKNFLYDPNNEQVGTHVDNFLKLLGAELAGHYFFT